MTKPKSDATKVGPFRIAPHIRDGAPSGRWLLDVPPHVAPTGKRQRIFLETKTAATAEAKRLLRELQLDGAIRGHGPKLTGLTFTEISKRWLDEQSDRVATGKKRPVSLETDAFWLKPLLATFGATDISKILTADMVAYQKARLGIGRKATTINSEIALLRRLLLWAHDRELLDRVPKVEQIPVPRKRVAIPTPDEMMRILAMLPARTALLVRFVAESGCRKGEVFALEWPDLLPAEQAVMIRRKGHFTPKTANSDRDVAISKSLMAALTAAHTAAKASARASGLELPPYVFPGRGGVKMTDFDKALARAVKVAGVVREDKPIKLTPHILRKAHASWLKMRGVDDSLLQPRLGHTPGSRITASTYIHPTTDAMRGAIIDLEH